MMGPKSAFFAGVSLAFLFIKVVDCSEIGTTPQYANYGEPCTTITDCDSNAYLTCVNGSCLCALKSMVFDDASSSCWVLPGEKCVYKAPDIGGIASLELDIERSARDRLSFRCVSNSACEDGFCMCNAGYFPTVNGTCERQREQGQACESNVECRSSLHLVCNNDKMCGCNETNSVFDTEHALCVGTVGSSCFDFELCVANALCPSFGIFNQYDVKCTCKTGYFETVNKTCSERLGYGASCRNNQECREDMSLACFDGKCACNSTTHVFEPMEGKCLALVGSSCQETQNCVSNAECQHSGFLNGNVLARNRICKCGYGYFESGNNKTCEKKHELDGPCTDDTQCATNLKLHCNLKTSRCSCNETNYNYDRSRKRCIGLAGTNCERNEHCVINSVCRSPGYLYPRQFPKAECICKDGYFKSVDGFCLGKFGSKCETWTNSCKPTLACTRGECVCPFGRDVQYYDYASESCVTFLNAPCANGSTCISNAHCANNSENVEVCVCNKGLIALDGENRCVALAGEKCSQGETSYIPCVPHATCRAGFCECSQDHFRTSSGTCERKRAYGEKCTSNESCDDSFCELESSSSSGICKCNSTTSLHDPLKNGCVRLAGSSCLDVRSCVPNAACRVSGKVNKGDVNPECMCKEGYYQTKNGTCEFKRGYFESCAENAECQDASDLICSVHSVCECNMTTAIYDDARRTCLRLVGSPCSSHQSCVSHAKCKNPLYWIHFDTFSPHAKCECEVDLGYTNSSDGRCIIDYYGGACDTTMANTCSSKFSCVEGRCVCPYEEHQYYDHAAKTCKGMVKAPCDNGTNVCVRNAHCATTEEGVSECRCKHGFIAVDRECELTFGQACSHKNNSNEPYCDRLAGLQCVEGSCKCGGFQYYDYEFSMCRGLLGSRCDPEDKEFCTEGALCEPYRGLANNSNNKKRYGRCRCLPGYFAEDNRTCTRILNKV